MEFILVRHDVLELIIELAKQALLENDQHIPLHDRKPPTEALVKAEGLNASI